MKKEKLRELSPGELALVSGGAQSNTTDLPPVEVTPPDLPDDDWYPDPPDTSDPWDPGDGSGGGGGGGDVTQVSGDSWDYKETAQIDGNGVATATQTWINPDHNLTLTLSESLNLATLDWQLFGNGSFTWNGSTYSISMNTSEFSISGVSATYSYDWGGGLKFDFTISFDNTTNEYSGKAMLTIPSGT